MTILIQHSYGKSDKIDKSIDGGIISGAIFSPKGETSVGRMSETLSNYFSKGIKVFFDPQFHLSVIENAPDAKIKDYPYFTSNLQSKDFISPKKVLGYVTSCLDFQADLDVTGLISPTCIVDSFEGLWCSVALQMAQGSFDYVQEHEIDKELYISFVISDIAFKGSKQAMDDFISTLTSMETLNKIYLIINKSSDAYSQQIETEILTNILYFIYSLKNWNNIEVICGYSDIIGLLCLSVGADAMATGWSQKTKFFSRSNYREMTGGSQPRQRYMSSPLLNSILNTPELKIINDIGLIEKVLSGTSYDEIVVRNPIADAWKAVSFYHHLESIKSISDELCVILDINERIDYMLKKTEDAKHNYRYLTEAGALFEQYTNDTHLSQWYDALSNLKGMIK